MDPSRYVLYSVLLLCAFAGYALAEPSWATVENVGEKRLTGAEKDLNIRIEVRNSNMDPSWIEIATRSLSNAYTMYDDPRTIMSYMAGRLYAEMPWGSGWNFFTYCGGHVIYTDHYIFLAAYVDGVLSSEYLFYSVNLVGYSSAEFAWNSNSLVEARTPIQEKDASVSVQVVTTNLNSTLVDAATNFLVIGHILFGDNTNAVATYVNVNFRSLSPSFNWNVVVFCTGFGFQSINALVMKAIINNSEEYNYALFSTNP